MSVLEGAEQGPLPKGWRWARLDDVGRFDSGGTPTKINDRYWDGDIPFITGADVTEQWISRKNSRACLTQAGFDSGKTGRCEPGTLLIVTRTRVGRVGIAETTLGVSQDLTPYACGPDLDVEFAYYYLLMRSEYLVENCRGATIKGLTRPFVAAIPIPIPSLAEQRRIASVLNAQMAAAERARAATERELEEARALDQRTATSLLERLFQDPRLMVPLGDHVESFKNGYGTRPRGHEEGPIVLRLADVSSGRIDLSSPRRGSLSTRDLEQYRLQQGDLLFIRVNGSRDIIGRCICVGDERDDLVYNDHLIRVRLKQSLRPRYVEALCATPFIREFVVAQAATSAGQLTINQSALSGLPVPVPCLSEQERIVAAQGELEGVTSRLQIALQKRSQELSKLPQVLLREAFAGRV